MERIRELIETKQYRLLRDELPEMNVADIAAAMEEMESISVGGVEYSLRS